MQATQAQPETLVSPALLEALATQAALVPQATVAQPASQVGSTECYLVRNELVLSIHARKAG